MIRILIYNTDIVGTYNFYTYPNMEDIIDKVTHVVDISLWKKYGTGPNDKSKKELREKAGEFFLGAQVSYLYNYLKVEAKNKNKEFLTQEEIKSSLEKFYEQIHSDNSDAYEK